MIRKYKEHPIIDDLEVSNCGKKIILRGVELEIKKHPTRRRVVIINKESIPVRNLVCEAWNGLKPKSGMYVQYRTSLDRDHYRNIFWGYRGEGYNLVNKIPYAERTNILNLYQDGWSLAQLAKKYKVSNMAIKNFVKKYLGELAYRGHRVFTQEVIDDILDRARKGERRGDIAVAHDISYSTVYKILLRNMPEEERKAIIVDSKHMVSQAEEFIIIERLLKGDKVAIISKEMNLSTSTVYRIRRQEIPQAKLDYLIKKDLTLSDDDKINILSRLRQGCKEVLFWQKSLV